MWTPIMARSQENGSLGMGLGMGLWNFLIQGRFRFQRGSLLFEAIEANEEVVGKGEVYVGRCN